MLMRRALPPHLFALIATYLRQFTFRGRLGSSVSSAEEQRIAHTQDQEVQ
jgi:hypothetical protein